MGGTIVQESVCFLRLLLRPRRTPTFSLPGSQEPEGLGQLHPLIPLPSPNRRAGGDWCGLGPLFSIRTALAAETVGPREEKLRTSDLRSPF